MLCPNLLNFDFLQLWASIVWSLRQSFYEAFVVLIFRVWTIVSQNISSGKCTLLPHQTSKGAIPNLLNFDFLQLWASIVWSLRQSFYEAFVVLIFRVWTIVSQNISSGKCTLLPHQTSKGAIPNLLNFDFLQLWASIVWSLRQSFYEAFVVLIFRVWTIVSQNTSSGKCTLLPHQTSKGAIPNLLNFDFLQLWASIVWSLRQSFYEAFVVLIFRVWTIVSQNISSGKCTLLPHQTSKGAIPNLLNFDFLQLWASIVWSLRQSFYEAFVVLIFRVWTIVSQNISSGKCTLLPHQTSKGAIPNLLNFDFLQLWASIVWSLRQSFYEAFVVLIFRVWTIVSQNISSGKCTLLPHQTSKGYSKFIKFRFFTTLGFHSLVPTAKLL